MQLIVIKLERDKLRGKGENMNSNIIFLIIFGSVEFCKNLPGRPHFSFDVPVDLPLPLRLEIDPGLQGGSVQ